MIVGYIHGALPVGISYLAVHICIMINPTIEFLIVNDWKVLCKLQCINDDNSEMISNRLLIWGIVSSLLDFHWIISLYFSCQNHYQHDPYLIPTTTDCDSSASSKSLFITVLSLIIVQKDNWAKGYTDKKVILFVFKYFRVACLFTIGTALFWNWRWQNIYSSRHINRK